MAAFMEEEKAVSDQAIEDLERQLQQALHSAQAADARAHSMQTELAALQEGARPASSTAFSSSLVLHSDTRCYRRPTTAQTRSPR